MLLDNIGLYAIKEYGGPPTGNGDGSDNGSGGDGSDGGASGGGSGGGYFIDTVLR